MKKIIRVTIAMIALLLIVWFVPKEHTIILVIPAGSQGEIVYAQEELLALKKQISVKSNDFFDDAVLLLKNGDLSVRVTDLTKSRPLVVSSKRGAWYTIGVSMSNPTQEDITVCISFADVKARNKDVPQERKGKHQIIIGS